MRLQAIRIRNSFHNVPIFFLALLNIILSGCGPKVKLGPLPEPNHFLFTTAAEGDTLESLAQQHLGDTHFDWRIREFNGIDRVEPGNELIIPLQAFRPGGLTASGYQLVPVLAYHHFSKSDSRKRMIVGKKKFDSQLSYLRQHGFRGITLKQFLEYLQFGQIPQKSVILTIDDGWSSAYSIAYPLLKKHRIPAVLFIPTNVIGERKGRLLTWGQLREMVQDESVEIQPHTKSHRDLTKAKSGESFASYIKAIQVEMRGARQIISQKLGREANSLSYPFGATNPLVSALAKTEGYTTAFSVKRAGNPFFQNDMLLNRSMIYGAFNLDKFQKNAKTFETFPLERPEPIDESLNLSGLDYRHSAGYESKSQWRTALMCRKLHRDSLVTKLHKLSRIEEDKPEEEMAAMLEKIKQADLEIIALSEKLQGIAQEHYRSAMAASNDETKRRLLLRALLYDPNNHEALSALKFSNEKYRLMDYTVQATDTTLKKVAHSVYHDQNKALLIPIFNKGVRENNDLQAGMVLKLPHVPKRRIVASGSAGAGASRCGVSLEGKSESERSMDFYHRAVQYFDDNRVIKAKSSLKKALCLDPDNAEAREMRELLEGL